MPGLGKDIGAFRPAPGVLAQKIEAVLAVIVIWAADTIFAKCQQEV